MKLFRKKRGFTLLELLVVIIIIGILATLALPRYTKTVNRFKWAEAQLNVSNLSRAYKLYYDVNNAYTTDFDKLAVDNPNTVTGRKFDYTLTASSGIAPAGSAYAVGKGKTLASGIPAYILTIEMAESWYGGAPDVAP